LDAKSINETIICKQFLKSGTSTGANIEEKPKTYQGAVAMYFYNEQLGALIGNSNSISGNFLRSLLS
jgi:hypothetical protein